MQDAIRRMAEKDLRQVLEWRNHPNVRMFMYSRHEISHDEHEQWFARAQSDPSKHLLIYERAGTPTGFVSFTLRDPCAPVADWGFYVAPLAPPGTGSGLGRAALRYGFVELSLRKICGQVLAHNQKSVRFHERLGFVQEGRLRQHHCDGERFYDVLCFGLLAEEWKGKL